MNISGFIEANSFEVKNPKYTFYFGAKGTVLLARFSVTLWSIQATGFIRWGMWAEK